MANVYTKHCVKMIIKFIIILFLILLLDLIWFTFSLNIYKTQVRDVQKEELVVNKTAAIFTYLLIAFGLLFIANIKEYTEKKELIINCGLFGLLTYGIYNFTSMSIYKDYPIKVAIMDTVWGGLLSTMVGIVLIYV